MHLALPQAPASIISPLRARMPEATGNLESCSMNEVAELEAELARLKQEHRDLDTAIEALEQ